MCPDRELLSAWVDGEIPSPWRETIDRHVELCATCAGVVASIKKTQELFSADMATIDEASSEAKASVVQRLEATLHARGPIGSRSIRVGSVSLWSHKFSVPFPAIAAAALVLAVLGFSLASSTRHTAELQLAVQRAFEATLVASPAASPMGTTGMGIESIIDYVSRQNAPISINISLPAGAFGGTAGDPFIVREADYRPASSK